MNYPQYVKNFILDTLFPIRCIVCGRFSDKNSPEYVCRRCLSDISLRKSLECIGCERPSVSGLTCPECKNTVFIDQLLVVSDYKNKSLQKIIKTLKYRLVKDISAPLAILIKKDLIWLSKSGKYNLPQDNPLLIPIPLHKRRLNWRGFNQADVIAQIISEITYCDMVNNIIFRKIHSKPQAEINLKEERIKNTNNIFSITDPDKINNRTVVLVDDVCTTGATLNEAARLLKINGATKVVGFVIARG